MKTVDECKQDISGFIEWFTDVSKDAVGVDNYDKYDCESVMNNLLKEYFEHYGMVSYSIGEWSPRYEDNGPPVRDTIFIFERESNDLAVVEEHNVGHSYDEKVSRYYKWYLMPEAVDVFYVDFYDCIEELEAMKIYWVRIPKNTKEVND